MRRGSKWSVLVTVGLIALTAPAQSGLPDGEGRPSVERVCGKCHAIEVVTRARYTEERWAEVVENMISRGAQGSDQEISQVLTYLVKHFSKAPKINVNRATAKEFSSALGLSAADGESIVGYREKNGSFREIADLKKVPGIDTKKVEDNKDRLEF